MLERVVAMVAIGVLAVTATACGSDAGATDEPSGVPAACPAGDADCYEDGVNDEAPGDVTDDDGAGSACLADDADCYEDGTDAGSPGSGMCLPDVPDCDDTSVDESATDQIREEARGLLGMSESALPDDVRIARRGDEQFALTEDYAIGRRTVEIDDTDGSGYRVVAVTIELPEGPARYEQTPG